MIALACDHGGFELMSNVKSRLESKGLAFKDFGTFSADSCDYPELAIRAAHAVACGECDRGILICGTGIGMSIAANKIPGIRAALCSDLFSAGMARSHNDANILTLGARATDAALALDIVEKFLNTGFDAGGRHSRRIDMVNALDKQRG